MPRKFRTRTVALMAATSVFVLLFAQWWISSQPLSAADSENLTNPLPGLSSEQQRDFSDGLAGFAEVETTKEGLGACIQRKELRGVPCRAERRRVGA